MSEVATQQPPAAAPPVALSHRRVLVIIGALLLGMLLAALDQNIVSTALPTIVGDLGGASHLSWVVIAYLLASTVSTPLWGKLGDLYGRKQFFQTAIVVFLAGSVLAGLSQSMLELILFRAIQGLGGGGLLIGAQAIIGDVVSPRDRGRYMGLFGAVFGVATVLGPLLGGIFVEYLSWRWVFYINIPIGIIALFVTAAQLPGHLQRVHRVIDYLGVVLLTVGATALILFTSLGGSSFPWLSAQSIGLALVGVAGTVAFVLAERRAVEPIVPLHLFRIRVFSAANTIGFVVGFAMFGALTFLPLFLQIVKGVSPTESGLRLFPVMAGLLLASIGSGQVISRWGRYKVFPIIGTALMTLGLYLLSMVGESTGAWVMSAYMAIFGIGLGLVMQVLVVAVQNAVGYEDLGAATSSAVFFRQIGGCFGTAIFGAIFANVLTAKLDQYFRGVRLPSNLTSGTSNPKLLDRLPPAIHAETIHAYATTMQTVFLVAVPVAGVAFLLSWFLPEIELRKTVGAVEPGEGFAMPESRTSLQEVERALEVLARRENRGELYRTLAKRAALELGPGECWLLYRLADRPACTADSLAARLRVPEERIGLRLQGLADAGLVERTDDQGDIWVTSAGDEAIDRLRQARQAGLTELLEGWDPEEHSELQELVRRLARELLADDEKLLADARPDVGVGNG